MENDKESPQEAIGYKKNLYPNHYPKEQMKTSSESRVSLPTLKSQPQYLRIRLKIDKSIRRYNYDDGMDLIRRGKAVLVEEVRFR